MARLPTPPTNVRIAERFPGPTLKSYAISKLLTDPVYEAVYEHLPPGDLPVLDIGCGIGLLGFFLREHGYHGPYLGVDPDPRKVKAGLKAIKRRHSQFARARARAGQAPDAEPPNVEQERFELLEQAGQDPSVFEHWQTFADEANPTADSRGVGHVLMLDVLHYFDPPTQHALLERMAQATAPGAWCILRLTPRTDSWRFTMTRGLERFARTINWMSRPAQCFPEIESVTAAFEQANFECFVKPLWGRTPFNGYLFAFHKPA